MNDRHVMRGLGEVAVASRLFLFAPVYRPWHLRWGATDAEVAAAMPGDELVSEPSFNATRALTIDAPPEAVWPWLVQIGYGRAGWYSYDLFDNGARPSAERILPEYQEPKVGDWVPMWSEINETTAFKITCGVHKYDRVPRFLDLQGDRFRPPSDWRVRKLDGLATERYRGGMATVFAQEAIRIHDVAHLSDVQIGRAVGAAPSTVRDWFARRSSPTGRRAERVAELAEIVDRLARVIEPDYIPVWLSRPIEALDDQKPLELIARGRARRVARVVSELESPGAV